MLAAVSSANASWVLPNPDGVEEWFVVFKSEWRKHFDKKWDQWLVDRRKAQLRVKTESLFHQKELPLISNRPWVESWGGIAFNKDYSIGFLTAFFNKIYMEASSILKTLLLEGEFVNRESRVALTDACNEMVLQSEAVAMFNARTRYGGQLSDTFENITAEKLRTLQNQSRMDSLMLSISSEVSMMSVKFGNTIRELIGSLEGVLKIKKTAKFDTISNLSQIQGKSNVAYRLALQATLDKFNASLDLLKELESIESSVIIATK